MKAIILFIGTVLIFLTSCNPCKRLVRKCPPLIRDSISYVETIKFDTITLVSPADTLFIQIPVEVPLENLVVVNETTGPKLKIEIKDGILEAEVICPEDSLKTVIAGLETELNNQTTITIEKEVPVNHIPKIAWICIIFSACTLVYIIMRVYIKIKGGAAKGLLSKLR